MQNFNELSFKAQRLPPLPGRSIIDFFVERFDSVPYRDR